MSVDRLRSLLATAVWLVGVLCALSLALGALLVALQTNRDIAMVDFVLDLASKLDFGVFKDVDPDPAGNATKAEVRAAERSAQTKSVMANWGLAAVIYLVAGRVLDRIIRPRS